MSITQNFMVKTYVGDYLVFKTETIHLPDLSTSVKIEVDVLTLEFAFNTENDGGKPNIKHEQPSNLYIKLTLNNFDNPLGTGILVPTKFGSINGKDVFFTFVSHLIGDKRSFTYTLLTRGD